MIPRLYLAYLHWVRILLLLQVKGPCSQLNHACEDVAGGELLSAKKEAYPLNK